MSVINTSERSILTNKRPLTNSLGEVYNDLYESAASSSISKLECTFRYEYRQSLSNKDFGGVTTINIPNDQFIDYFMLHLTLPPVKAYEGLIACWAYQKLASVQYQLGNSSSTSIVLQADSIFQTILSQSKDKEQRDEIIKLAGSAVAASPTEGTEVNEATLLIPLPFSNVCGRTPLDSSIMTAPIQVTIAFTSGTNDIYYYLPSYSNPTDVTSFLTAEIILRTGKLTDQSRSIKYALMKNPTEMYNYNFIHSQRFVSSSSFDGSSDVNSPVSVELNTFPNADLLGLMMYVVKDSNKVGTGHTVPHRAANPYQLEELSNIFVYFAGATIVNLPGTSYKLANMLLGPEMGPSFYDYPVTTVTPGTPYSVSSSSAVCYPVYISFSREWSACDPSHHFNVWRIPSQTLVVTFNTPSASDGEKMKLYCTYFVNAIAEFQNGTSAIYIN